jgi:nucleotide-binding universal stress UspA family protein
MRILIATGGSPHSDIAVQLGGRLTEITHGAIRLLTVTKHESERPAAWARLERALSLLPPALTAVTTTHVRIGQPADEIVQEARDWRADCIVVGSRPVHQFVKRFFDPVSERVVSHAPCPILVAKRDPGQLSRILICESGRDPSLLDRLRLRLPALLQPNIETVVLHVMSQIVTGPQAQEWQLHANAEELMAGHTPEGLLLEHDVTVLDEAKLNRQAKIRHGVVVDEIVAEAESGRYDLIVIGSHTLSGWERLLLDDVRQAVMSKVTQPMLIL